MNSGIEINLADRQSETDIWCLTYLCWNVNDGTTSSVASLGAPPTVWVGRLLARRSLAPWRLWPTHKGRERVRHAAYGPDRSSNTKSASVAG